MPFAPLLPLLSAVLWTASVAVCVRSGCVLALFFLTRREEMFPRVLGWTGTAYGTVSATLFSVGWWQAGVFLGVMAAGCGVLWRRGRNDRKAGREMPQEPTIP
jgi:hypothetical protein